MGRVLRTTIFLLATEGVALAQTQPPPPLCIPGTPFCAAANGNGGIQAGASAQGQVGPNGANGNATGTVRGSADANANARGNVTGSGRGTGAGNGRIDANGNGGAIGRGNGAGSIGGNGSIDGPGRGSFDHPGRGSIDVPGRGSGDGYGSGGSGSGGYAPDRPSYPSAPVRFGAGVAFCGVVKAGVYSGVKAGPCFAISFRTERLTFEMESELLIGGVRHSIDWVFPMAFVIPLTRERSLYEGLQLRVGGSPIGVTFAKEQDGGNYVRFGLFAGIAYEWDVSPSVSWRLFDLRAFLDFGTRRQVDLHDDFLDFGGQISTGIVF